MRRGRRLGLLGRLACLPAAGTRPGPTASRRRPSPEWLESSVSRRWLHFSAGHAVRVDRELRTRCRAPERAEIPWAGFLSLGPDRSRGTNRRRSRWGTSRPSRVWTNLKNWDKKFDSPFKSDVYFFSTRLQTDQAMGYGHSNNYSGQRIWCGSGAGLWDLFVPHLRSQDFLYQSEWHPQHLRNGRY